ncbi:MAG: hypothetical protein AAFX93_17080 [Verrucomicrobiota bacterium]
MNNRYYLTLALGCVTLTSASFAANLGTDNASATAYQSGWVDGTDGSITGPGAYGLWFLNADTADIIHEVASVGSLSSNPPNLNTGGLSFRMAGSNGQESTAFRFIDPSGLSVGQSFSIDLAVNFRNGFKGIDIRDADTSNLLNFNVGGDDYVVNDATTGNGSIGSTYSDNSLFTVLVEQTSLNGGVWSITRSGGVSDFDTGTYSGVPSSIKLYVGSTTGTDADALFFNNLSTIPEPGHFGLMIGTSLLGLLLLRRRL